MLLKLHQHSGTYIQWVLFTGKPSLVRTAAWGIQPAKIFIFLSSTIILEHKYVGHLLILT